jgi:hypothetical protein
LGYLLKVGFDGGNVVLYLEDVDKAAALVLRIQTRAEKVLVIRSEPD